VLLFLSIPVSLYFLMGQLESFQLFMLPMLHFYCTALLWAIKRTLTFYGTSSSGHKTARRFPRKTKSFHPVEHRRLCAQPTSPFIGLGTHLFAAVNVDYQQSTAAFSSGKFYQTGVNYLPCKIQASLTTLPQQKHPMTND
jgi:hypothetical protein